MKPTEYDAVRSLVGGGVSVGISDPPDRKRVYTFHNGQEAPTQEEIDTQLKKLQEDYENKKYQRDRLYPKIGEQLDMLWHDMTSGKGDKTGEWYKAISKVKSDHPKP